VAPLLSSPNRVPDSRTQWASISDSLSGYGHLTAAHPPNEYFGISQSILPRVTGLTGPPSDARITNAKQQVSRADGSRRLPAEANHGEARPFPLL